MLIQEKKGNLSTFAVGERRIDVLPVEWYETNKRIMRKPTRQGHELALRFLQESPALAEGDILYVDEQIVIVVEILPCDALVIRMGLPQDIAAICYEIGNRHLPLFTTTGELLAPFEEPMFRWLKAGGYDVRREERKLLYPLRSTIAAHGHADNGNSLFSKIMNLTNSRT